MTFNIEAMRRNRDAGTQAPWQLIPTGSHDGWNGWGLANQPSGFMRGFTSVIADIRGPQDNTNRASDARRIASVPSMEAEIERLTARVAELEEAGGRVLHDIDDLATHSEGVAGLHQNGDIAPWDSLFAGGNFEAWLMSIETLRAALSTPTEEPKT